MSDLSFEQPPWGPLGRSLDGSAGLLEAALSGRQGRPSAQSGVKQGMTRRGLVYEYIRNHPGTHVRGMAKELRLATGDLQYHLLWLERHGFVETKRSGFYRYVFPTMVFEEEEEALLGVLSQETPREIILRLIEDPGMTQADLARSIQHSQPTVSWHMERLVQSGVVRKNKASRASTYEVAADREDVLRFIRSYHPSTWEKWACRLGEGGTGDADTELRAGVMRPAVVELVGKN